MKYISQNPRLAMLVVLVLLVATAGILAVTFPKSYRADQYQLSEFFGVNGAVPSLASDEEKRIAMDKIAGAGFGWTRHEFYYEPQINYANYDKVFRLSKERGIKTLALLSYLGPEKSHEDWKNYVRAFAEHYKNDVAAWEIMNEIDNYLSPEEYVSYLKEAHDIIKETNPGATIVLSGLTSRPEATNFWNGLAEAGGWSYFDVIGLHHYHRQSPEQVLFGGGDLASELNRPTSSINKYGQKKIWVTEIGYLNTIGHDQQADWLARTLVVARSIPHVDKIFVYTLTNKNSDFPFGLLDDKLEELPAYREAKDVISKLGSASVGKPIIVSTRKEVEPFNSIDGWGARDKKNGTSQLSEANGTDGSGLKIDYSFDQDSAFITVGKKIPLGRPQAIAAWIDGGDAGNVWKIRFTDSKGETFQADLGAIPSDWRYYQLALADNTALVSWGGDGIVDYPISFDSIVIDRWGGKASGIGIVDEITAVDSGAELSVYQFPGLLAYWSGLGESNYQFCGNDLTFTEKPQFIATSGCQDITKVGLAPPLQPKPRPLRPVVVKASPPVGPDLSKSEVNIIGQNVPANGYSTYQLSIALKDTKGGPVTDVEPKIELPTEKKSLKVAGPVLIGDRYYATIASTKVGSQNLQVAAQDKEIKNVNLKFQPPAVAKPPPTLNQIVMDFTLRYRWYVLASSVLFMAIIIYLAQLISEI